MPLLDVNVLVALAWDSHVHHLPARAWFARHHRDGWSTCPVTESGFVRVSSNPKVLASPVSVEGARGVLAALRAVAGHTFLTNEVSLTDPDVPPIAGHRQVTDVVLVTVARRNATRLVTFDRAIGAFVPEDGVELLEL